MNIEGMVNLYQRIDDVSKRVESIKKEVSDLIIDYGNENKELVFETGQAKLTIVHSDTLQFDNEGLRQEVGEDIWTMITKQTVSQSLLMEMIDSGKLSESSITKFVKVQKRKPYVRVSSTTHETTSQSTSDD